METFSLASGSSGNSFYVGVKKGNEREGVIVDAGLSAKNILLRLEEKKIDPSKIRGIFITHEHTDHIKGADVFSRKFGIPIYVNKKTASDRFLCSDENLINFIKNDEVVQFDKILVESFSKSHSAADPVFFNVGLRDGRKKVGVITDAGYACKNIIEQIGEVDFAYLESNHDVRMLENGPYPYHLKKWILGNEGHLSNLQAGLVVLEHSNKKLRNVVLSHISKVNNEPQLALKMFKNIIKERKDLDITVTAPGRGETSEVFKV